MSTVGTVEYLITIDTNSLKGKLSAVDKQVGNTATKGETGFLKMGAALGAVAGIVSSVVTKSIDALSASIGGAVSRIDTMKNFPKVMANLGISADDSKKSIKDLDKGLRGLPTPINDAALSVQRLTSSSGDIGKSTKLFLAFNNAVLAGGAPIQNQQAALEQFTQAMSKGKFELIEWRSLQQSMPAQLKQVATAMGYVSDSDLYEALRDGKVKMSDFTDEIIKLNDKGSSGLASFADQAKDATSGMQTGFANMKTAVTRGVAKIIESIGSENVSNALTGFGKTVESGLSGSANAIAALLKSAQTDGSILNTALESTKTSISGIDTQLQALKATMAENEGTTSALSGSLKVISAVIGYTLLGAITVLGYAIQGVIAIFSGISIVTQKAIDQLSNIFAFFMNWIYNTRVALDNFFYWFGKAASSMWNGIKNTFTNIGVAIANAVGGAIKSVVNGVLSTAESTINRFIDAINGSVGIINKLPGVNISKIGRLGFPRLADGGIVPATPGGRLAVIGEGGEDEAVIPLSKLEKVMGGGTKTIEYKPNIYNQYDQKKALTDIAWAMR